MAKFPTEEEFTKRIAERALDEYLYQGKSIREWIKTISDQQLCEDCISREAVIQIIDNHFNPCTDIVQCMDIAEIKDEVKDLEPVTPQTDIHGDIEGDYEIIKEYEEPKTGRWLSHKEYCEQHDLIPSGLVTLEWCSNCDYGVERGWDRYNYCPNCGAKMEV